LGRFFDSFEIIVLSFFTYFFKIWFTKDEVEFMVKAMTEADVHQRERLRVVQIACKEGWGLARQLSAVQQGIFCP